MKKIVIGIFIVFFCSSLPIAHIACEKMLENISVCEKFAYECSIGNKTSCIKLKKHAQIMRGNVNRMLVGEKEYLQDGKLIDYIAESDSSFASKLKDLKKENPKKFKRIMHINRQENMCIHPRFIVPDSPNAAKIVELNLRQDDIIKKYKLAKTENERMELKSELETVLSKIYDIESEHMKLKIKTAKRNLDVIEENFKNRKRNKKERINIQMANLLK